MTFKDQVLSFCDLSDHLMEDYTLQHYFLSLFSHFAKMTDARRIKFSLFPGVSAQSATTVPRAISARFLRKLVALDFRRIG